MAASATQIYQTVNRTSRVTVTEVTMDSAYPAGGLAVSAAQLGMSLVVQGAPKIWLKSPGSTVVPIANFYYDVTNSKIKVFNHLPAEIANNADLTGVVLVVEAIGH